MTNYVTLAEAKKNLKGSVIVKVESIGELKAGTGAKGDWTKKDAVIKDKSGEQKLTLWNDDIKKIEVGKFYKLENPFWKTYENKPQLSLGNYCKVHDATESDLLDGESQTSTNTLEESQEPKGTGQQTVSFDDLVKLAAEFLGKDKVEKINSRTEELWAIEMLVRNYLKAKHQGTMPDPSRVGMYVKILAEMPLHA